MNYKSRNQSNELMNNINVRVVLPPQKKPAKRRTAQSGQLQTVAPKQQILSAPQPANYLYGTPQVPMGQPNLPQGLYFNPPIPPTFADGTGVLFNEPVADDISDITAEMAQGIQFTSETEIQPSFYEADFNRIFIEQQQEEQRARINAERALQDISREPSMISEFLTENRPMMSELGTQTEQPRFMSVGTQMEIEPAVDLTNVRGLEPSFTFQQPQSIFSLTELPMEGQLETTRQRIVEPLAPAPRITLGEMTTRAGGTQQLIEQTRADIANDPELLRVFDEAQAIIAKEKRTPAPMTLGALGQIYQKTTTKQLDAIGKRIQEDTGRKSNPLRKLNKEEKFNWIMENGFEKYL